MTKKLISLALTLALALFIAPLTFALDNSSVYEHNLEVYNSRRTDDKIMREYYTKPQTDIVQSDDPEITKLAKEITAGLTDDYSKIRAIHDWVSGNIWYDFDSSELLFPSNNNEYSGDSTKKVADQSASAVLENRYAVCNGYSNLTVALLRAASVPAKAVEGFAGEMPGSVGDSSRAHRWTEAFADGRWIIMDTTWDSLNEYKNGVFSPKTDIRGDYFDLTLEKFSQDHYFDFAPMLTITDGKLETVRIYDDFYDVREITIPDSVTSIGDYAFYGNPKFTFSAALTKITIPDTVTNIGNAAFYECASLSNIIIPDSVISIGNQAFNRCASLADVTLGNKITSIGEYAFSETALKTIKIPDNVINIGAGAFYGCTDLIIYGKTDSAAENYATPRGIKFIDLNAVPALTATPTSAKVQVNGKTTDFDAYTINGQTYYQIADIARAIRDTPKRFSAAWDGTLGAINLTSGGSQDGALSPKGTTAKTPTETKAKIYLDGKDAPLKAYTIDGHTYYQMKAVAELFDIGVGFANGTITVDTSTGFGL
jgi:hypothetical protein